MRVRFAAVGDHGSYRELTEDRSGFQRFFCGALVREPGLRGVVLDIGCGPDIPKPLMPTIGLWTQLDGVDPDPGVLDHPHLARRWNAPFEGSDMPRAAYDLAYAYNVAEHIPRARPFFRKLRDVLKPGGVFWALTPNAHHPFAALARLIEVLGAKGAFRKLSGGSEPGRQSVKEHPVYYRLNDPRAIMDAARRLGFVSAEFHYYPCMQWDTYFPRPLRWLPHLYDYVLGVRRARFMQILAYRLELGGRGRVR